MADRTGVGGPPHSGTGSNPRQVIPQRPPAPTTLGDLVLRAIAEAREPGGGRPALELLHARLAPGLRRFFRDRLPSASRGELVEELSQRAWVGVWESLSAGRFDPQRAAFSTYAYAVASNIWLQHLRSSRSALGGIKSGSDLDAIQVFGDGSDPNRLAESAEMLDALRAAIAPENPTNTGDSAGLNETDRWIVRLSANGHGDRAIAARLGIAASTLNERKQNAFSALRRFLTARGFRTD